MRAECFECRHVHVVDEDSDLLIRSRTEESLPFLVELRFDRELGLLRVRLSGEVQEDPVYVSIDLGFLQEVLHDHGLTHTCVASEQTRLLNAYHLVKHITDLRCVDSRYEQVEVRCFFVEDKLFHLSFPRDEVLLGRWVHHEVEDCLSSRESQLDEHVFEVHVQLGGGGEAVSEGESDVTFTAS